ncbi:MAG: NAD(P)/FAD-dependent oxidoreductase [Bacteroidales bacterium]|nr:NAD(P)/FAD-dependent oxidoreductase [Bacteroidales bacterium]
MEQFDVIIIGGGPAGLRCAEVLQNNDLKVLLLEKKNEIGPKICAGGVTKDFFRIYTPPKQLIEFQSNVCKIALNNHNTDYQNNDPFLFSLSRKELGQWQLSRINSPNIAIQTGKQVTKIGSNFIEINRDTEIGFKYLVGADGANSIVRRYLKLPTKKRFVTLQYTIQSDKMKDFEFYFDKKFFGTGYAWIFPHNNYYTVGCGCIAGTIHPKELKTNFQLWLNKMDIDPGNTPIESFPILFDYQGFEFGNIYLAGEAAGFTSGLSGEGIAPAISSGAAIAELILDNKSELARKKISNLIRNKKNEDRYTSFFMQYGILGEILLILLIKLLRFSSVQRYVWKHFP